MALLRMRRADLAGRGGGAGPRRRRRQAPTGPQRQAREAAGPGWAVSARRRRDAAELRLRRRREHVHPQLLDDASLRPAGSAEADHRGLRAAPPLPAWLLDRGDQWRGHIEAERPRAEGPQGRRRRRGRRHGRSRSVGRNVLLGLVERRLLLRRAHRAQRRLAALVEDPLLLGVGQRRAAVVALLGQRLDRALFEVHARRLISTAGGPRTSRRAHGTPTRTRAWTHPSPASRRCPARRAPRWWV